MRRNVHPDGSQPHLASIARGSAGGRLGHGLRANGDQLWLAADEGSVFVGTNDDVEVWPRTIQHLGCD